MKNIAKLVAAALMAVSASAAAAPVAAKQDSSCYDAYGHYGYSWAYCQHDVYGRSSPADRYEGQNRDLISQGQDAQAADRELYSYLYRGYAMPDRDDSRHYPDRDPGRDRG